MKTILALGLGLTLSACVPSSVISRKTAERLAVRQVALTDPGHAYSVQKTELVSDAYIVDVQADDYHIGGPIHVWVSATTGQILRMLAEQ